MNGHLIDNVKFDKVSDVAGAATTAVNSASVDMAADNGYDGVAFVTSFGTADAGNFIKLQQSDDNGSTDGWSDIAESAVDPGASDEDQVIDLQQPTKRYVRAVCIRGASSTVENIWAIRYNGRKLPVNNALAGTIAVKRIYRAAEGTA